MAVFGIYRRVMALAWFVRAYGFFALMIGPLLRLPGWMYDLSPFEHTPRSPSADFEILPLVMMIMLVVALMTAGPAAGYGVRIGSDGAKSGRFPLATTGLRGQSGRPTDEIHAQVDFYYERPGRRGVCVFVDGPNHDHPE